MHIPKQNTAGIEVLPFEEALTLSSGPQTGYDVDKWLYVPPVYDEYRYILGTKGKHPLICVGINPSTAEPDHLDPTLQSAQRIALHNGYDSFLMFNVYAQRATRPDDMEKEMNPWMHGENLKAFGHLLSLCGEKPAVWAAWGAIIEKRAYLPACIRDMLNVGRERGAVWYHAGPVSKAGHPHHPLYLKADTLLEPFDTEAYLSRLTY
ncbi:MAG: DUF1643 domain-containing protein [Clostridia bacterium]|nr:DUF1643 domain-containing protein [Clostridia bacterium]